LQRQAEAEEAGHPVSRWKVSCSHSGSHFTQLVFKHEYWVDGAKSTMVVERSVSNKLLQLDDAGSAEQALVEHLQQVDRFEEVAALSASPPFLSLRAPNASLVVMGTLPECEAWLEGCPAGCKATDAEDRGSRIVPLSGDALNRLFTAAVGHREAEPDAALTPVRCDVDGVADGMPRSDDETALLAADVREVRDLVMKYCQVELQDEFTVIPHRVLDDMFGAWMRWRGGVADAMGSALSYNRNSAQFGATHFLVRFGVSADASSVRVDFPGGWRRLGMSPEEACSEIKLTTFGDADARADGLGLAPVNLPSEGSNAFLGSVGTANTAKKCFLYKVQSSSPPGA